MEKQLKPVMKFTKTGKVFCSIHGQRAVHKVPSVPCRICWLIYDSLHRLKTVEEVLQAR